MNARDSSREPEVADLARMLPSLADHELPTGRKHQLKEHLMAEFRSEPAQRIVVPRFGRNAMALSAAAAVVVVSAAAVTAGALARHGAPPGPVTPGQPAAARLLSKIATAAAKSPAPKVRDSQFAYIASKVAFSSTEVLNGKATTTGPGKPDKRQVWISVSDLCRPGLLREGGENTKLTDDPGAKCPDRGYLNDPTYRLLRSLPTDPHALLKLIFTEEKGHGQSPDQEAFTTIGDLLNESIAPPNVSAALYRAAALIPGVTVVAHAKDAIGRSGVAVAFTDQDGIRSEWIFNRHTLKWLGERDVDTKTGKIVGESAVLTRAFVDKPGQLPPHS